MGEKEWQAVVTIVEEGNISKAAEKLFISQPALSYRIRQIENELNTKLFLRTNGSILLTPEGEVFYEYCHKMLREEEAVRQTMGNLSGEIRGTIKIASSINFADFELPVLLNQFTEKYPNVHIQVKTSFSNQVHKLFNSGEYMVAFARGDYAGSGNFVKLLEEPYCLVYHKEVSPEELVNLPFLNYISDPTISLAIQKWFSDYLPEIPKPAMELDSMATCRHFVREGLGWTILPYMGLGSCKESGVYIKPIIFKNGEELSRESYMFYDEESLKLTSVKIFIDFVKEYYANRNYKDIGIKPKIIK